jgi:SAM-dependent methyltransferase
LDAVFDVDDYLYVYGDELTDERSDAEVSFWVKLLNLDASLRILDVACGFGRHANRLAALGNSVTGVDVMPGFLDIARQQAEAMGVQVDYWQADMRQLEFEAEFDRVQLLFTSFGYFDDDENRLVIDGIARALKPGGLLGLDVPNRDAIAGQPPASAVIDKNGGLVINRMSFDVDTGRFHNRRIVVRDGVRKDIPFSIRLYNAQEIRTLLGGAGLEIDRMLGGDGQPLSASSQRLLVIARKPVTS